MYPEGQRWSGPNLEPNMTRKNPTAAQTQADRAKAEAAYAKRPTPKNLERLNYALSQERAQD